MEADRPLLMIPGPIEFSPAVLKATGEPSPSHVSTDFINLFSEALVLLRQVQQLASLPASSSWISFNHFLLHLVPFSILIFFSY
jgi:aspartate aminotransferase-like enzyme